MRRGRSSGVNSRRRTERESRRPHFRIESLEGRLLLAQFLVKTTADDGADSLRQAILEAAGNSEADTITFDATLSHQTISLTSSSPNAAYGATAFVIANDDLTIDAGDAPGLRISGSGTRRIFAVASSGTLTLSHVTLADGQARGGNGNGASGGGGAGLGGAVLVDGGALTITNATLTNNLAQGGDAAARTGLDGGAGGGLAGNGTGGAGGPRGFGGGGVGGPGGAGGFGQGGGGGGGGNAGGGNGGAGGFGGGGGGGGFGNFNPGAGGASGFGGGAGGFGGGGGGGGMGGALFMNGGVVKVVNSTLTANRAVKGNGSQDGAPGLGYGGSIFNRNGSLTLLNATIANNGASNQGSDVYALSDGGTASVSINNTIIHTPAAALGNPDLVNYYALYADGANASGVGNLFRNASAPGVTFTTGDPQLGPLADNGGTTPTLLPASTSPVLEAGDDAAALGLTVDQRGQNRFRGTTVDIGAVEVLPTAPPTITSPNAVMYAVGNDKSFTITTTGLPTAVLTLTGSLPAGLDFIDNGDGTATLSGTPEPNSEGVYTLTLKAANGIDPNAVQTLTLTVNPALAINPALLPASHVGVAYSQQLTTSGGSGTGLVYTAGALPPGLTLSSTGLLSGTPTSAVGSPFSVKITVTDDQGGSTSQSFSILVGQSGASISLSNSANPTSVGQQATFTAQVRSTGPASAIPTGTVTFKDGGTVLAVVPLVNGTATLAMSDLTPGPHQITAEYSGDSVYLPITSDAVVQSVLIDPAVTFTAAPDSPSYGEPVRFTLTVAAEDHPSVPGGLVAFYDGGTLLGTVPLDVNGTADITISDLAVGPHAIKAVYAGNAYVRGVSSPVLNTTVARNTSVGGELASSASLIRFGETVTLTATFAASSAGSASMSGSVEFYDGDTFLGRSPLIVASRALVAGPTPSNLFGQAVLPDVMLPGGDHLIRAVYSGDANFAPGTLVSPVSLVVDPAPTRTALAATTPTSAGGDVTLTASVVASSPGNPPVVGSVAFFEGDTLLGTAPVTSGVARLNVGTLAAGPRLFRALYVGDGSLSSSEATILIEANGPKVVGLSRVGVHFSPTRLVLTFDGPLETSAAQRAANYRIVGPGGRPVPVTRAVYDASSQTVTLHPARRLNLHRVYTLVVNGRQPNGLTGVSGVPLDGSGLGRPGSDFVAKVTRHSLAGRGANPAESFVSGVAQRLSSSRFIRLSRLARGIGRPRS